MDKRQPHALQNQCRRGMAAEFAFEGANVLTRNPLSVGAVSPFNISCEGAKVGLSLAPALASIGLEVGSLSVAAMDVAGALPAATGAVAVGGSPAIGAVVLPAIL